MRSAVKMARLLPLMRAISIPGASTVKLLPTPWIGCTGTRLIPASALPRVPASTAWIVVLLSPALVVRAAVTV